MLGKKRIMAMGMEFESGISVCEAFYFFYYVFVDNCKSEHNEDRLLFWLN